MRFALQAMALRAPGLNGWSAGRACLTGELPWDPTPQQIPRTELLRPNERRRVTRAIRLVLALAEEATADLTADERAALPVVFASAVGDSDIVDGICSSLASPGRPISPTQFHNSVHNAPAGYWAIATGNRRASTSVAAGEWTAGCGLQEALSQLVSSRMPVLAVIYDVQPPAPLRPYAGVEHGFGMAYRLAPVDDSGPAICTVEARCSEEVETRLPQPWETLRRSSPAAGHLGLAHGVATRSETAVLPLDRYRNMALRFHYDR